MVGFGFCNFSESCFARGRDCFAGARAERAAASKTQKTLPAHPRGPEHTALEEQPLLSSFGQPLLAQTQQSLLRWTARRAQAATLKVLLITSRPSPELAPPFSQPGP